MPKLRRPKIGDKLYLVGGFRKVADQYDAIVTKVGRKYFTVGIKQGFCKFHIATWQENTDYTAHFFLYDSKKEYDNKLELDMLLRKLREDFDTWGSARGLRLDQLRSINRIVENN